MSVRWLSPEKLIRLLADEEAAVVEPSRPAAAAGLTEAGCPVDPPADVFFRIDLPGFEWRGGRRRRRWRWAWLAGGGDGVDRFRESRFLSRRSLEFW